MKLTKKPTMKPAIKALLLTAGLPLLLSGAGALLLQEAMRPALRLTLPLAAPSGQFLALLWPLLYLLPGAAAWLVWARPGPLRQAGLLLYGSQLAVNLLWPLLFFQARAYFPALLWLLFLLLLAGAMAACFARHRPLAAWLLPPYLLWLFYAVYLNLAVWLLNPIPV